MTLVRIQGAWVMAMALLAAVLTSGAGAETAVPPLTGHVIDQTGTFSKEQTAALEQTLTAFEVRKGSQLAVLVVPSSAPEETEPFALRVAEKWKLGRKKVDDGAILVVAKNDRAVRIEVGYGLEGPLNDATSKRIISETILPRFKQQDFYGGITAGVDQIIRVVDGESLPKPGPDSATNLGGAGQYIPVLFILVIAIGGFLRASLGKVVGPLLTGGAVAVIAWFLLGAVSTALIAGVVAVFVTMLSGGMGGFYGGMGGRGMGGGFSGGGGGFGGGGASGRW